MSYNCCQPESRKDDILFGKIGVSGLQEILRGDSGEVFQETLARQCTQWHRGLYCLETVTLEIQIRYKKDL